MNIIDDPIPFTEVSTLREQTSIADVVESDVNFIASSLQLLMGP